MPKGKQDAWSILGACTGTHAVLSQLQLCWGEPYLFITPVLLLLSRSRACSPAVTDEAWLAGLAMSSVGLLAGWELAQTQAGRKAGARRVSIRHRDKRLQMPTVPTRPGHAAGRTPSPAALLVSAPELVLDLASFLFPSLSPEMLSTGREPEIKAGQILSPETRSPAFFFFFGSGVFGFLFFFRLFVWVFVTCCWPGACKWEVEHCSGLDGHCLV